MWHGMFNRLMIFGLVVILLASPLGAATAQEGWLTHTVAPGQDIFSIAAQYGVGVPALILANKLPNANLTVGQKLVIPPATPVDIAAPLTAPPSNPQGPTAQAGATVHLVAPGDSLYRIAGRYGLSVEALAWANGLRNVNLIYVGQRLVIPNRSGSPALTVAPRPAPTVQPSASGKEIVVVLSQQRVYAYANGRLVHSALASTGLARTPTPVGSFRIYVKYLYTLMSGPGYYLPNVPYTMYFYGGYGLHGTYWHNNFGRPMSHGCVNLPTAEAKWFYDWAPVGTLVTVKK